METAHRDRDVNSHLQLSHLDPTIIIDQTVTISPLGLEELGTLDYNLRQLDTLAGMDLLGDDIDASTEAEN